jgi:hypothetical protein
MSEPGPLHVVVRDLADALCDGLRLRQRQLRAGDAAAGARRALAPARRFVILGVADVRAPGGALTLLTGFR